MIETDVRDSGSVRVPSTTPGHAIVVTRYDVEKAVVLHPHDFRRLATIDAALDELESAPSLSLLALEAHALEDSPDRPLEDLAAIKSLLGL